MLNSRPASILGAIFVLAYSFGLTNQFSLFSQDIRISLLDVSTFVLTIFSISMKRAELLGLLNSNRRLFNAILVFSLVALLALLIAGSQLGLKAVLVGSLYLIRWLAYALAPFIFATLFPVSRLRTLLLFLGISTSVIGLYQYHFFPDVRHLEVFEWDPHYYRVVGAWLDPGFTGLILVFTLIHLTLSTRLSKFIQSVLWSLAYLSLALTYSRSSYLAFLVAFAYMSWKQKSYKFLVFIAVLFTLTTYLLPRPGGEGVKLERTSTVFARIQNWKNSLFILSKNPVIGVGFNTYRYAQAKYGFLTPSNWLANHAGAGADSSLLFVAATTGIIGLFAYLNYLRSWSDQSAGNLEFQVCLAGLLVHSLFLNSLFYPAILAWLAILTALKVRT